MVGAVEHLVLARRHRERRPLLAHRLYELLAGAQAVGACALRVSPGQRGAPLRQLPARLAAAFTPGGARGLGRGRGVRPASAPRRVGGMGHRTQGPAFHVVLPGRRAHLDSLHGSSRVEALWSGPGTVHRGAALQIGGGHASRGAADLALVAARPDHFHRSAPAGAILRGGTGRHPGRPGLLHLPGAAVAGLLVRRAGADRLARVVVLRRQAAVAHRSCGDLSAVGTRQRRPHGLGLRRGRGGGADAAMAGAASPGAGGRWPALCSSR